MPRNLEAKLEAAACQYARDRGWLVYKFVSPSYKGVPDRICISPTGITVYCEFKSPKGKLSALQARTIEKLIRNGCFVGVFSDIVTFCEAIDALQGKKMVVTDK